MGGGADFGAVESLDRETQHLTQAELDRLRELLTATTGDGRQ
ncbi:hypothetical protein HD596_005892 [Nonomuraea jabiensis]|uniref:Uncharacterized protein n=1 Tax=Nonomuraea jabiensis TaxID=882448 RepID=A0A7W9G8M4_9ACTN|nr:hypothetical protein [Nonomuraea jabiensis]